MIGLILCNEHFDHVVKFRTDGDMWKTFLGLFQRRTFLSRLPARCKYHMAGMGVSKKVASWNTPVCQLPTGFKFMNTKVGKQDVIIIVLCGLPVYFEQLKVDIKAIADNERLALKIVKSCLLQEGQRVSEHFNKKVSGNLALLNNDVFRIRSICSHCKWPGHTVP